MAKQQFQLENHIICQAKWGPALNFWLLFFKKKVTENQRVAKREGQF
jgi:hypothetical protein